MVGSVGWALRGGGRLYIFGRRDSCFQSLDTCESLVQPPHLVLSKYGLFFYCRKYRINHVKADKTMFTYRSASASFVF